MARDRATAEDLRYMDVRAEGMHIVGRDWKYGWWNSEVETAIRLWTAGCSVFVIASRLNATVRDTFHLLEDLAEHNKIPRRDGLMWGGESVQQGREVI